MFRPLCLLLITTLCWQYACSRHLGQRPYYMPYSDYSYTYSGPGPLYQQQQHSPFFSPPGTYFDHRQGILRPFPGGGVPVLVDYHKRCSNQYVGLKAHPEQHQYYYVCKPDCVIFGKCQNLQIFNATSGQCVQHPTPEYKPICTEVGRFPLFSDCHLYYKCEEDLKPKIYSCPSSMVFSPISKKCIDGHKCTPTQISPHSTYISEVCASKFPPCFENGVFRSPSDCSLYYKCDLKSNGVYMQTRLKCPQGHFYDLQKNECLPAKQVPCDCIQVAELVYPKPHTMHFQPAVYPAQFELDSLEEGYYPVEQTKDESNHNCNSSDSSNVVDFNKAVSTTLATTISETTLNEQDAESNDVESAVLSDYIDMEDEDDKSLSKELEPLSQNTLSSEETSGSETDSEETENQSHTEDEGTTANVKEETENVAESVSTNETSTEEMHEVDNLIEHTETFTTEEILKDMEMNKKTNNLEETATTMPLTDLGQTEETTTVGSSTPRRDIELEQNENMATGITSAHGGDGEATTARKELEQEEETTTAKVSTRSIKSQPCENVEFHDSIDTDTHTKNTTQTQINKCLEKLTTNISNKNSEPKKTTIISKNTVDFRNSLHEHNSIVSTTVTTIPETTHLTRAKIAPSSDISVKNQLPHETTLVPHRNNLQSDMLDSRISSEEIKESNAIEDEFSSEDTLNTETSKNKTTVPVHSKKSLQKTELGQDKGNKELQVKKSRQTQTTTIKTAQARTAKIHTATRSGKQLIDGTTGSPTGLTTSDDLNLLGSHTKINDFETSAKTEENLDVNSLLEEESTASNQKLISTNADSFDFSDEEFIPVHSKSAAINELPEETTDYENRFDYDYTTIISEKEFTTTAATITRDSTQPEGIVKNEKGATLKRRQDSPHGTTQLTVSQHPTQATVTAEDAEQLNTTLKIEKNATDKDFHNSVHSKLAIHRQTEEVSNNVITSAETSSNSKTQELSHTHFRTFTSTQTSTATSQITTTEPSEQETDNFTVHIRKADHKHPTPKSPPNQSLYYTLETTPVINNNSTSNNNETVTAATSGIKSDNGNIPRLEIIAERPIDVHLSICPPTCESNHTHNNDSPVGNRAVLLKWFANKSKQTMGFETANELNTDDD